MVLTGLGASPVDWAVRMWVPTKDYFAAKEAMLRELKMHLDRAGIGIPFPQKDVHFPSQVAVAPVREAKSTRVARGLS